MVVINYITCYVQESSCMFLWLETIDIDKILNEIWKYIPKNIDKFQLLISTIIPKYKTLYRAYSKVMYFVHISTTQANHNRRNSNVFFI